MVLLHYKMPPCATVNPSLPAEKYVSLLAFGVARQRSTKKPSEPPGKNWARAFEQRHLEFEVRRTRSLTWNWFNIYDKVVHWFEVMGKVLPDPVVVPEIV